MIFIAQNLLKGHLVTFAYPSGGGHETYSALALRKGAWNFFGSFEGWPQNIIRAAPAGGGLETFTCPSRGPWNICIFFLGGGHKIIYQFFDFLPAPLRSNFMTALLVVIIFNFIGKKIVGGKRWPNFGQVTKFSVKFLKLLKWLDMFTAFPIHYITFGLLSRIQQNFKLNASIHNSLLILF